MQQADSTKRLPTRRRKGGPLCGTAGAEKKQKSEAKRDARRPAVRGTLQNACVTRSGDRHTFIKYSIYGEVCHPVWGQCLCFLLYFVERAASNFVQVVKMCNFLARFCSKH